MKNENEEIKKCSKCRWLYNDGDRLDCAIGYFKDEDHTEIEIEAEHDCDDFERNKI